MAEKGKDRQFEERLAILTAWVDKITSEGKVEEIDPDLLRSVLEEFGANFESKPELESLSKYSNLGKRPGLDAVWGSTRIEEYRHWVEQYVLDYEQKTGRPLPVLEGTRVKTSGMKQFFGELTALAAGKMHFEKYKRLTEDRARKGKEWHPVIILLFRPNFPGLFGKRLRAGVNNFI